MSLRNRWAIAVSAAPLALFLLATGCSEQDAHGDAVATEETEVAPEPMPSGPKAASPAPATEARGRHHQDAPDFDLPNVDGGTLKLSSLRGKVVLLDFWATWCGPCRAAIPHLNTLYADHKEAGFEIVGVSVDQPRGGLSGAELVQRFGEKTRMDYPTVMANASVVSAYGGIRSIPTAFLIDQQGKIRKRFVGLQPKHVFEKAIQSLLEEGAGEEGMI